MMSHEPTQPDRRGFLSGGIVGAACGFCVGGVAPTMQRLTAAEKVVGDDWFPSKYGKGDQIGAANLITPEVVLAALKAVKKGIRFPLGLEINSESPAYPPRRFDHYVIQNIGTGCSNNDDLISGSLNVGTQIDGLGHLGVDGVFYNGNRHEDFVKMSGLTRLGIEKVPPLVTRGLLLDLAAVRRVDMLKGGEVVTKADIEAACQKAGVAVRKGDVVLLHTGWLGMLKKDRDAFTKAEPGPGIEAANHLAEQGVVAVGADTPRLEADPHERKGLFFPVHQILLAKHGAYVLENVNTQVLVDAKVAEFLFVLGQPRITGATQTFCNPVAIA
jgi:kynurenine formamidase